MKVIYINQCILKIESCGNKKFIEIESLLWSGIARYQAPQRTLLSGLRRRALRVRAVAGQGARGQAGSREDSACGLWPSLGATSPSREKSASRYVALVFVFPLFILPSINCMLICLSKILICKSYTSKMAIRLIIWGGMSTIQCQLWK